MTALNRIFHKWLLAMAAGLLLVAGQAEAGGTFRFLTTSVPDGTTNGQYFAKIMTANATGKVQFSLKTGCGAQCDTLPTGLTLDPLSGAIIGKPTVVETKNVTIIAEDDLTQIELYLDKFKISASGGGGNSGASIATSSLPDGRVGVAYTTTLSPSGGVGPFIYGAQDLPAGITINGSTGVVSGTPKVAGTFYVTFTVDDQGEGNRVISTLPLTVYPADPTATYLFKFDTYMLNNGEVGTAYSDTYLVSDEDGTVTFSATGLPDGLAVDPATGIVSGTPTIAGTFYVLITATDNGTGVTISLNLPLWIAPHAGSDFYWNYFGVPAALYGTLYDRQPPILVSALNGTSVTYSAVGLPQGITYNASTGELSGTSYEVGLYPVTYTATDSSSGEVLILNTYFVVLPPGGGDVGRLAVNLWIKKLSGKINADAASAPNDSWQAQYIYNADRRTGKIFDPLTQTSRFALGSSTATLAAGSFAQGKSGVLSFKSAKGVTPGLQIKGTPTSQVLSVKFTSTELGPVSFPAAELDNNIILGGKGYGLKVALDAKGKFVPTSAYRNASFVVATAKAKDTGSSKDNASLTMYLADPSLLADFTFVQCSKDTPNCNQPPVRLKLYDGTTVLLDKDLTTLLATSLTLDKNALPIYKMKKVVKQDPVLENILSSFSFDSKKGQMKIGLKNLVLATALGSAQAHVGVEVTIGNMSYFTSITLFESKPGSSTYNSKFSQYATPFP